MSWGRRHRRRWRALLDAWRLGHVPPLMGAEVRNMSLGRDTTIGSVHVVVTNAMLRDAESRKAAAKVAAEEASKRMRELFMDYDPAAHA